MNSDLDSGFDAMPLKRGDFKQMRDALRHHGLHGGKLCGASTGLATAAWKERTGKVPKKKP